MVSGCRKCIILVSRTAKVLVGRLVRQRLVRVLVAQSVTLRGHLVQVRFRVLLRSAVSLELASDSINWQVVVHEVEIACLDLVEKLVTHLTDESVVVFSFHVHDELLVAGLSTLGQSHDSLESDRSLENCVKKSK